ncbi:MAG: hypothetical protein ACYSU0_04020, partial [Planctomycetota bacterium]
TDTMQWSYVPLHLELLPGRYWVTLTSLPGDGGTDLDTIGVVSAADPHARRLPNTLVGGRLEGDGHYIDTGPPRGDGRPVDAGPDETPAARAAPRRRVPGIFEEAESRAEDDHVVSLAGASGGRAVADFNASGRTTSVQVDIPRDFKTGRIAYRVVHLFRPNGPDKEVYRLTFILTSLEDTHEVLRDSIAATFRRRKALWHSFPLDARVPAGRYRLDIHCDEGDGGSALDVAGILTHVRPGDRDLPNTLVGGRLEGGGYYIGIGPPKVALSKAESPTGPGRGAGGKEPAADGNEPPDGLTIRRVIPESRWRRVEGSFVEAESGVRPEEEKNRTVMLENVSDDEAVKDFNVSDNRLSVELALRRGAADAYLVYRCIPRFRRDGPDPAGHNVWVTVTSLRSGRMLARKHVSVSHAGSKPMWVWKQLDRHLPAGSYRIEVYCKEGDGGSALDVIGIVPGSEHERGWLPNYFSRRERRFQERGYYIEVAPVVRMPILPRRFR